MAIVTTDDQHYADIAAAIRGKNGSQTQYLPQDMAQAITALSAPAAGMRCGSISAGETVIDTGLSSLTRLCLVGEKLLYSMSQTGLLSLSVSFSNTAQSANGLTYRANADDPSVNAESIHPDNRKYYFQVDGGVFSWLQTDGMAITQKMWWVAEGSE